MISEEVDMTTAEIGGESLGWLNGSVQRQHGRRSQGRQRCWRSVGVGYGGGRQQQGRWGTEAADNSKGVGVWDDQRLRRQQKAFICDSLSVWDGRSVGDGNLLFLVLYGQHGWQ